MTEISDADVEEYLSHLVGFDWPRDAKLMIAAGCIAIEHGSADVIQRYQDALVHCGIFDLANGVPPDYDKTELRKKYKTPPPTLTLVKKDGDDP
jgi:hypothetical protein